MFRFAKMQGLGNDFVVVGEDVEVEPGLVRALCSRRFGVGADGVLRVSAVPDGAKMDYWNADGSMAEMCGNGLRCVARWAFETGIVGQNAFVVHTLIGPLRAQVGSELVTVEMGPVTIGEPVAIDGHRYIQVNTGNPHAVRMVDDPDRVEVTAVGERVGTDPAFPEGTNVEFVQIVSDDSIRMRVWERGVGETLACGTGMVAAAAAGRANDEIRLVKVAVPGGTAVVEFDGGVAWLTGPAITVFEGTWPG